MFCSYDSQSSKFKLSSRGSNKGTLEDSGDGLMSKYRKFFGTSIGIGFRTIQHAIAINEQTDKGMSYFHPRRNVQIDERHTGLL